MKVFLILCFSVVSIASHGYDFKAIKDIRLSMYECGYKIPNIAIFKKNMTQVQYDCLISKNAIVNEFINNDNNKRKLAKQALSRLEKVNISTIQDAIIKDLVIISRGF